MAGHVRKLATGKWQARWYEASGRERTKTFPRKSDADKHLTFVNNAVLSGTYVDAAAGRMTVGELADQWLAGKVNLAPGTRQVYESVLSVHVRPRWGSVPLSRVDHGALQAWIAQLIASGMGSWYVHKVHNVMTGIMGLAVRSKRLPSNPCDDLELPRIVEKPKKYLTASQVEQLAREASTLPSGRPRRATDAAFAQYRLVVYVLAYCGLRWSELAALRVESVNLMTRRITVSASVTELNGSALVWGPPKNGQVRWVSVPRFLADELAQHLAGKSADDLVFTSPDGQMLRRRNACRAFFNRAASAIGQDGLTPHELRHTAASLAVSAGANVKAVQRMLGHASATLTLDRYADLFDDDLDAVGDRLDAVARNAASAQTEFSRNLASVADIRTGL